VLPAASFSTSFSAALPAGEQAANPNTNTVPNKIRHNCFAFIPASFLPAM
jgi:hypothetical protein